MLQTRCDTHTIGCITSLQHGRSGRLSRRPSRSITSLQQGRSGRLSQRSSRSITSLQQARSGRPSRSSTWRLSSFDPSNCCIFLRICACSICLFLRHLSCALKPEYVSFCRRAKPTTPSAATLSEALQPLSGDSLLRQRSHARFLELKGQFRKILMQDPDFHAPRDSKF